VGQRQGQRPSQEGEAGGGRRLGGVGYKLVIKGVKTNWGHSDSGKEKKKSSATPAPSKQPKHRPMQVL
jgi:hypothetical protein